MGQRKKRQLRKQGMEVEGLDQAGMAHEQAAVFREFQPTVEKETRGHSPGPKDREKAGRPDSLRAERTHV